MDELVIDFDIMRWKLSERIAFERVAKMTVERAATVLSEAGEDESKAIDIAPVIPAAFMWIMARRKQPGITFEEAAETFSAEDFFAALGAAAEEEEEEAPLASPEQRPTSGKSADLSACTSTTPQPR